MKKRMITNVLKAICLTMFLWSCEENEMSGELIEKTSINCENEYLGLNTRIKGDAHSGNYFSRMDSSAAFGYGQAFFMPDSLLNKNYIISIDGWMRSGQVNADASIVITVNSGDSMLNWQSVFLNSRLNSVNQWINFSEDVMLSKNLTNAPNLSIKIFGYYPGGKSTFDIDDLNISLKTME